MIFIMKIAPYLPDSGILSKYESYDLVTRRIYSPHLKKEASEYIRNNLDKDFLNSFDIILCSNENRAIETAKLIQTLIDKNKNVGILSTLLLNEIKFSMSIITEDEYAKNGSIALRKSFIENYIIDNLIEKRDEISERIKRLVQVLKIFKEDANILCVSHSFFMKVLNIFLISKGDMNSAIKKYFNPNEIISEFCGGFVLYPLNFKNKVKLPDNSFLPVKNNIFESDTFKCVK